MKKLTLKQLYGYSIMNWEQFQRDLERAIKKRKCSFCRDSDWECKKCKINKEICDIIPDNIFGDICNVEFDLELIINDMIYGLREEYYKVK